MTDEFAQDFAAEWIAAWNAHDLARILAHYDDDFEMSSPVIVQVAGEPTGRLRGKAAVGAYWAKALAGSPDLHFELKNVLVGVDSIVLYYGGHRGASAEWFQFGANGRVIRAAGHYALGAFAR
jgi:ketosteroid isomerase-like protein